MRKIVLILILMLGLARAEDQPTYIVQPADHIKVTKNMIFLFDCSTSMSRNNRFETGLKQVKTILSYPVDDARFSLICFKAVKNEFKIWPGFKEEGDENPPPEGWAKLPSENASKAANKFLNEVNCNGYTDIGSVIKYAFEQNANRKELTIILFTDGNNTHPFFRGVKPSKVAEQIKALQKTRTDNGKDQITIFVFGVSEEQNVIMLSEIAKAGNGGYLTTDNICATCRANKRDIPEIQQEHRSQHISKDHPDYDGFPFEFDDSDLDLDKMK